MTKVSIIVAVAKKDRAIGKNNQLLWDIPADLAHFKKVTDGHPVIMGQKTFDSIGKPLPNRTNIVLNIESGAHNIGCETFNSIPEAIQFAKSIDKNEVFIIGGGMIYKQTLPLADRLYVTEVEGDYDADTYFPDYSEFKKIISEEKGKSNGYNFNFLVLERK